MCWNVRKEPDNSGYRLGVSAMYPENQNPPRPTNK
jgi:hypothetical protein